MPSLHASRVHFHPDDCGHRSCCDEVDAWSEGGKIPTIRDRVLPIIGRGFGFPQMEIRQGCVFTRRIFAFPLLAARRLFLPASPMGIILGPTGSART